MNPFIIPPSKTVTAVGMGVFDGIHRGHRHVLEDCDTLLTFDPHPQTFFNPTCDLQYLTPLDERQSLFDHVVALRFDDYLAHLEPLDFLNLIKCQLSPQKIVIGYDFKFGKQRQGDCDTLTVWGKLEGIDVDCKDPYLDDGVPVKSAQIRCLIKQGEMKTATQLLGRAYQLIGIVVSGDKRGRKLGYPTANLQMPSEKLIPREGVYHGSVLISEVHYACALSIGSQPTFGDNSPVIEAHIIGFNSDLYGQKLTINIHSFIREQRVFNSQVELKKQIEMDIKRIINV